MARPVEPEPPLHGKRILVVEDEILIALHLKEILRLAGAEVLLASTLAAALQGARDPDLTAAVLDVRLGRQTSDAAADVLRARGIPFLFYTGHRLPDEMRLKFPDVAVLSKPTAEIAFIKAMRDVLPTSGRKKGENGDR